MEFVPPGPGHASPFKSIVIADASIGDATFTTGTGEPPPDVVA